MMTELRFDNGETDFKMQLENIKKISPDAILIWGNAKESALILKQIRELDMQQPIYGSDRIISDEFLGIAAEYAEGIVTTSQYNPNADNTGLKEFQKNYSTRFGLQPDVFAAHAYDGMNMIIKAIRNAGLNRVLIRDVLTDLKTFQNYDGITGTIVLDGSWNDIGDIWMAEVKNGKFKYSIPPAMGVRNQSGDK
jgi:ABC-type branched-subunit amino acid transport system substrate-binding protein